ncbi:MAG TPA: DUF1501 domain-containing protein [Gemmataceae bacterium]
MLSRRTFLRSSLVALAPAVPGFLARTARAAGPRRDARLLVVVQLDGGNDGVNTVVPFKDEGYAKHRRQLRLPEQQLVKVNDEAAFHPAMREMSELLQKGSFAAVQGVGYPNPNRSHFESMAIWHSARREADGRGGLGWIGRAFDAAPRPADNSPSSVYVGPGELPVALRGRRCVASGLTRPEDFVLDATVKPSRPGAPPAPAEDLASFVRRQALDSYATAERMADVLSAPAAGGGYPSSDLARHLQLIARLIKAGTGTRVFYARQGGYDTHAGQYGPHQRLLSELSEGLAAFLKELEAAKLAERVCVLMFSEFGRTVKENGSAGTDHGTAGPVLLAGPAVRAGLIGKPPSLTDLDPEHGDLRVQTDFRQVYAGVLKDWLEIEPAQALGGEYEAVKLFK